MYYLNFNGDITAYSVSNMQTLLLAARDEGINELTVLLASKGGDVDAGIALYNFIHQRPVRDIAIHVTGNIASIGVTILLAAGHRSASPASLFTLHQATYSDGPNRGQRAQTTSLIAQPFRERLNWTDDQIEARFGPDDFTFAAEQAVELGCINRVAHLEFQADDQIVNVRMAP